MLAGVHDCCSLLHPTATQQPVDVDGHVERGSAATEPVCTETSKEATHVMDTTSGSSALLMLQAAK